MASQKVPTPFAAVCVTIVLVTFVNGQTTSADNTTEAAPPPMPSAIERFYMACPQGVEGYCGGSCSAAHLSCICGQEHCDWVYYTHDLFKRYAVIYEQIRQPPLESNKRTKERQVYCMERLRMDHHDDYNLTATSYAFGCTSGATLPFAILFDTIDYIIEYSYIEGNPVRPHLIGLAIACLVIGILGNLAIIIIAFYYIKPLTPTFVVIANVAIADFMFCIVAEPVQIKLHYSTSQKFFENRLNICKLYTFIEVTSFSLSILLNLLLAIDRYIIICHPIKARKLVSWKNIAIAIAVCWLLALALALPNTYYIEGTTCEHVGYKNPLKIRMLLYHLIVIYIIPITITFVIYCMAIDRLRKDIKDEKENGVSSKSSESAKNRMKLVGLLVSLFIALVVLWGPRWIIEIIFYYKPIWLENQLQDAVTREKLIELCEQLSIWSTCVNPILLFLFSPRYRCAVGRLLCCKGPKVPHADTSHLNSGSVAMTGI